MIPAAAIATAASIWQSRHDAIESARVAAGTLAAVLAEEVSYSVQSVDLVLDDVARQIERDAQNSPASFRSKIDTHETFEFLQARLGRLAQADGIAILDETGAAASTTTQFPTPARNFSDRDYFVIQKEGSGTKLFIGAPVFSRVTGRWTAYLSRRLEGPSGEFLGVVMIGVRPREFMHVGNLAPSANGQSFELLQRN